MFLDYEINPLLRCIPVSCKRTRWQKVNCLVTVRSQPAVRVLCSQDRIVPHSSLAVIDVNQSAHWGIFGFLEVKGTRSFLLTRRRRCRCPGQAKSKSKDSWSWNVHGANNWPTRLMIASIEGDSIAPKNKYCVLAARCPRFSLWPHFCKSRLL